MNKAQQNPNEPKNTPEQEAVIGADPSSDVLVVAGAGSGKTYTMTERIIALINNPNPSERVSANCILGLTFTNKAAQELQSRVSKEVGKKAMGNGSLSRVEALSMRPQVMTYDAFFQSIVRQYGLLVGVDQSVVPLSDAGRFELASSVVSDSMAEIFQTFDSQDDADASLSSPGSADDSSGAASEQPVSRFDALVQGILDISDDCLNYMIDEDHLSFDSALEKAQEWNDVFIDKVDALLADAKRADPELQSVLDSGKESSVTVRKSKKKDPDERIAQMKKKIEQRSAFRALGLLNTAKERRVLLRLAKVYNERKRQNHFAEFSDFTVYALQLLVRFPSIAQEYRRRYTHVFLDEYQDTSTTQAKLIARLFHSKSGKDAEEHVSEQSSEQSRSAVTAVGDPFQSIYAWRGASPGAFAMFRSDFEVSGDPRPLTYSMRNPRSVLGLANALTVPLRERKYMTRKGTHSSSRMNEVDVNKLNVLDTDAHPAITGTIAAAAYATREQEAAAIARFAKKYAEKYSDDSDTPVAVLVHHKRHMVEYAAALADAGLNYEVVGFSQLMHKPEIQDLFSLLDVVVDHTNTAAVMRLLASPRYGLSGRQLGAFAALAERTNMEHQYAALMAAGLGTGSENLDQRRALVKQHRDEVPTLVSLVDVLIDENLSGLLATYAQESSELDEKAIRKIGELASALRSVEAASNLGVPRALHSAVEALDLDIDLVVGAALKDTQAAQVNRSSVSTGLDVIFDMVDTYSTELPPAIAPSLRGFVEWMEAFEKDPDEPAVPLATRPDVVLMTIHQAKGLGWRAVAVASMDNGVFPSVSVRDDSYDGDSSASPDEATRQNLYYSASARSWIEHSNAVPAPMRSDSQILPRFPHDARPDDPLGSVRGIDSLVALDAEVHGLDEPTREVYGDRDFLALDEEYGSRDHADERRLAYVAVTRSKDAALLTFCGHPQGGKTSSITDLEIGKAGAFWKDAADYIEHRPGALTVGLADGELDDAEGVERQRAATAYGESAEDLMKILVDDVEEVTPEDMEAGGGMNADSAWPLGLNHAAESALRESARAVLEAADGSSKSDAADGILLKRAKMLAPEKSTVEQRAEKSAAGSNKPDSDLNSMEQRVLKVLPKVSLGATQIQRFASEDSNESDLLGILRPVPQPPNFAADLGTRFHAWAQELLDEDSATPQFENADGSSSSDAAKLSLWQHRLAESAWAHRPVEAVEEAFVINVFGLRVVARIDAVFRGWYRQSNSPVSPEVGKYTIVDWKTGRKPESSEDVARAQLQLDLYRLAFSRNRGVPIDAIDACLYYVNQKEESARTIFADASRTQADIEAQLKANSAILNSLANTQ